jgi:hypothetical protein
LRLPRGRNRRRVSGDPVGPPRVFRIEATNLVVNAAAGVSANSYSLAPLSGGTATEGRVTFVDQKTSQRLEVRVNRAPSEVESCGG